MLAVAAIHTIALILIGPIGIGYAPVVWPWKFAMVAYAWILFWNYDGSLISNTRPDARLGCRTFWAATNFESVLVVGACAEPFEIAVACPPKAPVGEPPSC